jgi:hypothetical protein
MSSQTGGHLTPISYSSNSRLRTVPKNFQSHVTTDGQSASLSWNKEPIWGLRPDLYYCLTVAGLLIWGALADERTGLSFVSCPVVAAGPRDIALVRTAQKIPLPTVIPLRVTQSLPSIGCLSGSTVLAFSKYYTVR